MVQLTLPFSTITLAFIIIPDGSKRASPLTWSHPDTGQIQARIKYRYAHVDEFNYIAGSCDIFEMYHKSLKRFSDVIPGMDGHSHAHSQSTNR